MQHRDTAWGREVKFRTFLWEMPCQALLGGECLFCARGSGAAVVMPLFVAAVSELDRSPPLELAAVLVRANGECGCYPRSVPGGAPLCWPGRASRAGQLQESLHC